MRMFSEYKKPLKKKDTGVICANGDQITKLCSTNGLVIGGSIFQHNDMLKITGCSPNDRVENTTSIQLHIYVYQWQIRWSLRENVHM